MLASIRQRARFSVRMHRGSSTAHLARVAGVAIPATFSLIMTNTDRKIWTLIAAGFVVLALQDLVGREPRVPPDNAVKLLEDRAHAQCAETIGFHYKRAKLGIPNTTNNAAGDVLIAQVFSVPVFGYSERFEHTAMCVLRRSGEFEFGVSE